MNKPEARLLVCRRGSHSGHFGARMAHFGESIREKLRHFGPAGGVELASYGNRPQLGSSYKGWVEPGVDRVGLYLKMVMGLVLIMRIGRVRVV